MFLNFEVKSYSMELSAKSAVLYEPVTQRIIFGLNEEERMPMASTTKIATAITVLENMKLSDMVTVSKKAAETEGSSIWLEEGEKMSVEDLLYGLMLASGNDAAVALCEHLSDDGNRFITLMNESAKRIGCNNTSFMNPNGLDQDGHYTTALDLAKITSYGLCNPKFKEIVATQKKSISWENHKYRRIIQNHNKLLKMYDGYIGVKTGYTKKDGRCLVSAAERNGITLVAVTLNAPDDWNDHIKMLDYGFEKLELKEIINKNQKFTPVKVGNLENEFISIMYKEGCKIPVLISDVVNTKNIIKRVNAPVLKNQPIGYTEVYLNDSLVKKIEIVSNTSVDLPAKITVLDNLNKILINIFT